MSYALGALLCFATSATLVPTKPHCYIFLQLAHWAERNPRVQLHTVRDVLNAAVIAGTVAPPAAQMLKLWRRLTPDTWAEQLNKRAAGLLIGSYMKGSRWPEVLDVFQQRMSDAQVGACMHEVTHAFMALHHVAQRVLESPSSLGGSQTLFI